MKILIVHTRYKQSAGGEDTTVDAESALFRSKGHQVSVEFFNNAEMGTGMIGKLKTGMKLIYNPGSAARIGKVIEAWQPDVLHIHNTFFAASPSILYEANRRGIPVVMTIHNYRFICANSLLLRDNKVCELCIHHAFPRYGVKYKCYHESAIQSAMVGSIAAVHKWIGTWKTKVDMFITPAAFMRSRLLDSSLGVSPGKMQVKRNFISDPGVATENGRKPFYLFIGRLSAEKGVSVLLEAWKNLGDRQLTLAGDGPDRDLLVSAYGHLPNVTFLGKKPREEVVALMKECKALIFPSIWYEGLPLTIVEAFATGTPVIASSLGAMQEMIQHERNGLLFTPGDKKSLADAIHLFESLLGRGEHSLYRHARASYLEHYHPDACYQESIRIYNEVISKKTAKIK